MALVLKVVESKPRVFMVSLTGKLDSATYPALEEKIDYLISEGGAKVITLDLAELEFISSMGVRVMFKAKKDLARTGGSLFLARVPPPVAKVLEIISALPSMRIFSSVEELDAYLAKMQKEPGGA
ncbi:MAG: STAS domain-containing protein [Lentisphaerae bacterium]|nr:STAS domain-containing protein [Lentisphaerota bacterium]